MDKEKILKLSEKNKYSPETSIEEIKKSLEKKYNISYGKYSHGELKKAIVDSSPFFIQNNLIIGFDPTDNKFISDKKEKISIERLVKAVIIEDEKDFEDRPPLRLSDDENSTAPVPHDNRDPFIIMGKQDWTKDSLDEQINRFNMVFGNLKVGELFLPPHSVIVNFLEPTDDQKKKKIVSMILGNNISLYDDREYIDNTMHEIGHIFWRDCVKFDERKKFYEHFKLLRPGAIYEFEWEKSSEEEVFCTVYKWYLKSLLVSKSFYNILAFEDEKGLNLLEAIFDRKRKEAIIKDMWDLRKEQLFEYLQPKFDITSNSFILKKGLFDEIKDIEVPEEVQAEAMDRYEDGHKWIALGKAMVPVVNGRIDWDEMKKAKANHKYKNKKPDGKGGWIYDYGDDVKKKPKGMKQTDTPEFKKWFGDSKVVDKEGKPLIVYHGTSSDFKEFDINRVGSNNDPGMWGQGFYFSPHKNISEAYGKKIKPVYLSIQNPLIVEQASRLPKELKPVGNEEDAKKLREKLISLGYDGVIHYETGDKKRLYQIVAFHPTQIKSATGNAGSFNPNNPDMTKAI